MIIYHCWHAEDMAQSDHFAPTLALAIAHVRENYDIKGPIQLDAEGCWEGEEGGDGFVVYIERENIQTTRTGLCRALAYIPNR